MALPTWTPTVLRDGKLTSPKSPTINNDPASTAAEARTMHGIKVEVTGSKPSGNSFTANYQSFESTRPPGVGPEKLKSPIFFDLSVKGLSRGSATVWITHDTVTNAHKVNHWNGNRWVDHPEKKVTKKTIQAEFKVSDLDGTPIVIGT